MKNIPKAFTTIQTIVFPFWSLKYTKIQFLKMSIHLGDSFDYVFNPMYVFKTKMY
jgi:hypothetical protein